MATRGAGTQPHSKPGIGVATGPETSCDMGQSARVRAIQLPALATVRDFLTVSLITRTCDTEAGIRESTSGGPAVFPAAAFRLFMTRHTAVGTAVVCCRMVLHKGKTTAYACMYSSPYIDELHRGGREAQLSCVEFDVD
ncbi:uncharacterized protein LOC144115720 [Amblyomma americanum]